MDRINEYIKSIVGKLEADEKLRNDMEDEFRDHLNLIKKSLQQEGLSEEEATAEAIRQFGDSRQLSRRLAKNIKGFRNIFNSIAGIVLSILLYVGGTKIPVPFMRSWDQIGNSRLLINVFLVLGPLLLFMPAGYFLPIIFKRAGKVVTVAAATLVLGLARGMMTGGLYAHIIITSVVGGVAGGILGFLILKLVSKTRVKLKSLMEA
ncbi:hypothetical protein CLHUN_05030 [Ruminiclostridium hungatei]|uniref:Uncharacterized protein n=1 Tax=Ruminiclostridium hungatei TaxID=48256 RepID=A0A1V4SQ46_RUMHU|nr:permease prefix domain 1-containing protein [Ruminiclostridium hungatei]OPX46028.1 hypothetical protein CLHUN_05030 [Ruminiclostridium hungatei]